MDEKLVEVMVVAMAWTKVEQTAAQMADAMAQWRAAISVGSSAVM